MLCGRVTMSALLWVIDWCLTLKQLGHFFQNVFLFSHVVYHGWYVLVRNYSNTMNILTTLWILMTWCFSTKASVATVVTMQACISQHLGVKSLRLSDAYVHQWTTPTLDQIMACSLFSPSHYLNQWLLFVYWTPGKKTSMKFQAMEKIFIQEVKKWSSLTAHI